MLGKRMVKEHSQISKHYKEQAGILENKRFKGVKGWIDFESWD